MEDYTGVFHRNDVDNNFMILCSMDLRTKYNQSDFSYIEYNAFNTPSFGASGTSNQP